jgi:hypothetical protein
MKQHYKNIYLMFDETTDANGSHIHHLLAGECSKVNAIGLCCLEQFNYREQIHVT